MNILPPCDLKQRELCAQVHYPPYLFEAFLFQPVDDAASTARVTDTCVFISLPKKASSLWKDLLSDAGMHTASAWWPVCTDVGFGCVCCLPLALMSVVVT